MGSAQKNKIEHCPIPVPTMRSAQKTRSPSLPTTSIPHIKSKEAGTSKASVFDASRATLLCQTENTTWRNREPTLSDKPAETCAFYRCMCVRKDDTSKKIMKRSFHLQFVLSL